MDLIAAEHQGLRERMAQRNDAHPKLRKARQERQGLQTWRRGRSEHPNFKQAAPSGLPYAPPIELEPPESG